MPRRCVQPALSCLVQLTAGSAWPYAQADARAVPRRAECSKLKSQAQQLTQRKPHTLLHMTPSNVPHLVQGQLCMQRQNHPGHSASGIVLKLWLLLSAREQWGQRLHGPSGSAHAKDCWLALHSLRKRCPR